MKLTESQKKHTSNKGKNLNFNINLLFHLHIFNVKTILIRK